MAANLRKLASTKSLMSLRGIIYDGEQASCCKDLDKFFK